MGDDLTKTIAEQINDFPPLIRYPALLMIIGALYRELPKAEREYNTERQRILENLFKLLEEKSNDD